jgi:hypothetical protein
MQRGLSIIVMTVALASGASVTGAAEPASTRQPISWSLVQAGPRERSLEIGYVYGGCERNPMTTATEYASGVSIAVTTEAAPARTICPAIAQLVTEQVALRAPLRGRRVLGTWTVSNRTPAAIRRVPRVIGLAPGDARRVVDEWIPIRRLHASIRVRHDRRGLPRVTSQSPAAGAPAPSNGLVRLSVSEP